MEELKNKVLEKTDELVEIIENSVEYKRYTSALEQLNKNEKIKEQVKKVRKLQQSLVKEYTKQLS